MNDDGTRSILQRLAALERTTVTKRIGEITDVDPLTVSLGGSDDSVTAKALAGVGRLDVADVVLCLTAGPETIILGRVGDGGGVQHAGQSGSRASVGSTLVALTSGPTLTVQESGLYLVHIEASGGQTAAGVGGLRVALFVNGVEHGTTTLDQGYFVASAINDGGRFGSDFDRTFTKGDVLTIGVANTGNIATTFSNGEIIIRPSR